MRPQGFSGFGTVVGAMDDLGWNDMGHHGEPVEPAQVQPIEPSQPVDFEAAPVPPVLQDRAALQEEYPVEEAVAFEVEPAPIIEQLGQRKRRKKAVLGPAETPVLTPAKGKAKAAFTLRLDEQRHLRLRLASALTHQSAQQLVTAALDAWLERLPEVEALAMRSAGDNQA
jgi:hypothetical protein